MTLVTTFTAKIFDVGSLCYCPQFPVTSIPRALKAKNWQLFTHVKQRSKSVSVIFSWTAHRLACANVVFLAFISLQKVLNSLSRKGTHAACFQMTNTVFCVANALYSVVVIFSTVSRRVILALFYFIVMGQFGNLSHYPISLTNCRRVLLSLLLKRNKCPFCESHAFGVFFQRNV